MTYQLVDGYRAEIQAREFERLTDGEVGAMRYAYRDAVASHAIEDMHGSPEDDALFEMLLEERAPWDLWSEYVLRHIRESNVPRAAAKLAAAPITPPAPGTFQDPYCYPGTTVLKNKFGIMDRDELKLAERKAVICQML